MNIGINVALSWWLGIIGALVFVAASLGIAQVVRAQIAGDVGCLPTVVLFLLFAAIAIGYGLTVRAGNPPNWILDPPSLLEFVVANPPGRPLVTERIIACVVGSVLCLAAVNRRR